ncbi:hypothetical protein HU200_059142 [Digitaria exilis]|uniref:K-box domain-containing protein n=1 Tax=Digitaria exilis TaxID=1010633 RepID=A0A835AGV7_9POAL|nr:hypothetical protein HU200_059142 [Digitaria exilis]
MFEYPSPPASLTDLIRRYEAVTNTQLLQQTHCTDHHQMLAEEIGRLSQECKQLEASLMKHTGEDLSSLPSVDELDELEQQLELALSKVRARKDELLINLTGDELQLKISGSGGAGAGEGMEEIVEQLPPSPSFAYLLNVNEKAAASTVLQLWPQMDDGENVIGGAGDRSSSPPPPRGFQLW